jgi:hypothetical protein
MAMDSHSMGSQFDPQSIWYNIPKDINLKIFENFTHNRITCDTGNSCVTGMYLHSRACNYTKIT